MLTFFTASHIHNLIGIAALIGIGYAASMHRTRIAWSTLGRLFLVLIASALLMLHTSLGMKVVNGCAGFFEMLYHASERGTQFLFGALANASGPWGFIFLIKVFPVIIFFSALIAVLQYAGILQFFIEHIGRLIRPLFGTKGPETLCAVANSFLGQTEAPLLIRAYLTNMNESELFAIMVTGMGTISCGIMAVYSSLGISMQHLLAASIMSISSTLFMAKLWYPDTSKDTGKEALPLDRSSKSSNVLDALAQGATDGAWMTICIGAMLIVIISLLGLLDGTLCSVSKFLTVHVGSFAECISLKKIFGIIGMPAAWALGIESQHLADAGNIIGMKIAVNEMVAYSTMTELSLDERARTLLTYACCGFSNFSSIGIQLGGIGALAPSVRGVIGKLGVRAVCAAACANLLNALIIGLIVY